MFTSEQWLTKLVSYDTTSHNSNLELISCIQDYLHTHQIESRLTYDDDKKKANLFASLADYSGNTQGGLVLSGHTDVVPVDGQDWQTNPFKAEIREGRIYGRGTTDMKGFIAALLSLVPEWKKAQLKKPLHFAFSYDEEVGCHGAMRLIEDLKEQGIRPDTCIVGEPTELRPVLAHKGIHLFRCQIHGKATHSSLTHLGCNAIDYAAELIVFIRQLSEKIKSNENQDEHYDLPYTSVSTNLIRGGNAYNTIPELCEFYFEFRNLPNTNPKEIFEAIHHHAQSQILPKMKKEFEDAHIDLVKIASVPSFEADVGQDWTKTLLELTGQKKVLKVSYATEAGLFQQAQIPTILCGPGSIKQAHGANEYLELSQLQGCEQLLRRLVN